MALLHLSVLLVTISSSLARLNRDPSTGRVLYTNYSLIKIPIAHSSHGKRLQDFALDTVNFLVLNRDARTALVAVSPSISIAHLGDAFNATSTIELVHNNVQELIDAEAEEMEQHNNSHYRRGSFSWKRYHSLEQIHAWLGSLERRYPEVVSIIDVGSSYENRKLRGVRISYGHNNDTTLAKRPAIFIEGGIHAREWISPALVTYLINELLTSDNASTRAVAEAYDWYIVPSVNPDGYAYSHTTDRMWRKTRKPYGTAVGADPNRNWDNHWSSGQSPDSETYGGPKPFSEIEMATYSSYLHSLGSQLRAYISFHSFSQLLMYPYGYSNELPVNHKQLHAIGRKAAKALERRHGTKYKVGTVPTTVGYKAFGSSMDYVYDKLNVSLTFTYELRPSRWSSGGFLLPAKQIIPVGEETVDSVVALLQAAQEMNML